MKPIDKIKAGGSSLLIHFGATGETQRITSLPLSGAISIWRDDKTIYASISGNPDQAIPLEDFGSEHLAASAFLNIKSSISAHARYRSITHVAKSLVKWGLLPAVAVFLALALNVAVTKGVHAPMDTAAAQAEQRFADPVAPPWPPVQMGATPSAPSMPELPAEADPEQVRKALATGLQSGKYSIQRSPDGKTPLYVFSDPSCPFCQRLERELEKLGSSYTIHIFPVSVIGGESSAAKIVPVLCSDNAAKADLWVKATDGSPVNGESCESGKASLSANDQIFRGLHFLGTPTLINENGEQLPLSVPMEASSIAQWLDSSAGK